MKLMSGPGKDRDRLPKEQPDRHQEAVQRRRDLVRMTARIATTKNELAQPLSGRLHAFAEANGLIRRSFGTIPPSPPICSPGYFARTNACRPL